MERGLGVSEGERDKREHQFPVKVMCVLGINLSQQTPKPGNQVWPSEAVERDNKFVDKDVPLHGFAHAT